MTTYLLDTNHLSAALESGSPLVGRIASARRAGHRFGTCAPVLCELAAGIAQTVRRERNWQALQLLLRQVSVWPIDLEAVRAYGELYVELKRKGRVLSQVDIMVGAIARTGGFTLLTSDRDFEAVERLDREDWTPGLRP
ncbi:MAG: type II toxin-antitoxin system VapC family toxin [Phycisphaeraceae bacterium]|nr:type II toxin-antitoxin system VapC family toxin [Phycisphaeraceae bacterium]